MPALSHGLCSFSKVDFKTKSHENSNASVSLLFISFFCTKYIIRGICVDGSAVLKGSG